MMSGKIILQFPFFQIRGEHGTESRGVHHIRIFLHIEQLGVAGGMLSPLNLVADIPCLHGCPGLDAVGQ